MRRLTRALALGLLGCAQASVPPGGPPDEDPPRLMVTRPDTNAVNVTRGWVGFDFDEVISERPQGAPTLAGLFLISPSEGTTRLSWRRTRVEVQPRGGFRPNTTYSITMLPGLVDLDGNVDSAGTSLVFSTGPSLASARVTGLVFDWMADRPASRPFVEAIALPDSARYIAYADSTGTFTLEHLPPGRFLLRAIVDQNRNRLLDARELFDTTTLTLADSLHRELYAIPRDTLGPGIERIELVDSLTLRVRFDRVLDSTFVIAVGGFTLKAADSSRVTIHSAMGARAWQKARDDTARVKAVQDSIRAAFVADSTTKADSVSGRPKPPPRPPAPTARPGPRRPGAPPAADSGDTARPPVRANRRLPDVEVILTVESELPPGANFRLRAADVRSMVGRVRSSERQFATPRRRPAADSAARRDTSRQGARGAAEPGAVTARAPR